MNTRDRIATFIKKTFYIPDGFVVADDASLLDAGIIDSTGTLEVIAFVEGEFGVRVEDHEITSENLDSVDRIAAFVARKAGAMAVASVAERATAT